MLFTLEQQINQPIFWHVWGQYIGSRLYDDKITRTDKYGRPKAITLSNKTFLGGVKKGVPRNYRSKQAVTPIAIKLLSMNHISTTHEKVVAFEVLTKLPG